MPETLVHYRRWLDAGDAMRAGAKPATLSRRPAGPARRGAAVAGLRVSKLVAVDVADVTQAEDGSGRLAIVQSKTDQLGEGALARERLGPDSVPHQLLARRGGRTEQRAAIIHAQAEAEALQAAVNEDEERRTADNAERSDIAHAQDLERVAAAGRDYADRNRIAAGGMWATGDRGASGQAPAAAVSGGAGLPEGVPTDPFVAVRS